MTKIKVLFLAANPKGTKHLALDEEIREITRKIQLSEGRDILDVVSAWAVRPDDLLQSLNQYKPQIVHFSGHGSHAGEIILVDNNSDAKPVSPHALKALFTTLKDNIQIVVLNACYSRIQGEAINEVINYVIGMNKAIGDIAAIVFAASFYRALGFNRTIKEAFDQAKTALLLEGIPEENTPELLIRRGVSPHKKISPAASQPKAKQKKPEGTEKTGDEVIDNVLTKLRALADNVTDAERVAALAPLFERAAFQGHQISNWNYFLYAVCRTRLLLNSEISNFDSPLIKAGFREVAKEMLALEDGTALLYGAGFSLPGHIKEFIHSSEQFINKLPPQVKEPDTNFLKARANELAKLRKSLREIIR